ncbi:MAG: type II toxin-antitoxin system Phd/YefM family antitoxin [Clostridia bacterium]|nr:type II toxin-antitoxin system Phd/YefM family antitoxin [Clostridia bacterium]
MNIDSRTIASMTEANQNFSRIARIADHYGEAVIFKNNKPKYRLIDIERDPVQELTDDEKIDIVAKRILKEYRAAFEELAK